MTETAARLTSQDVEVLEDKGVFNGFFSVRQLRLRHRLFAGGWGPELTRELFVRGSATCMLPYDPWQDKVVLCEQFRIGALGDAQSPWLIELVAGIDDPGETPEQVAVREAQEEAGLDVLDLTAICQYYPSPGGSNEWISLYCGIVKAGPGGEIHGLDEEGEDIRVLVIDREEAFAMIRDGRINNAASIIGLQWLQMNVAELRSRWAETSD